MRLQDMPGGQRVAQLYAEMTAQIQRHPHQRDTLIPAFVAAAFAALLEGEEPRKRGEA